MRIANIGIIRCIALILILLSLYCLAAIYQQLLPLSTTPPTTPTHNNSNNTSILIVSDTPYQLLAHPSLPLTTKQLHTIYVWILQPTGIEQQKYQFVSRLHRDGNIQADIVFVHDYVQWRQDGLTTEDWLTNSHLYFHYLHLILLDPAIPAQFQHALLQHIRDSGNFTISEGPTFVLAISEPQHSQGSPQCDAIWEGIVSKTTITQISTPQHFNHLLFSPKIKMIQPLHHMVSISSLPDWLAGQKITTLYLPEHNQESQQQAIMHILIALSHNNNGLTTIVRSRAWHTQIIRNLVLNDAHAEVELFLGEQGAIWAHKNVVGLYSLSSFERELDGLRARIISDNSKVLIFGKDEGINFVNIKNQFSVVSIEHKMDKSGENMLILYSIQKTQKKQIQRVKAPEVKEYTFTGDSLSPLWQKQSPVNYELSYCFLQRHERVKQYFMSEASREKYAGVLKYLWELENRSILWCWAEYELFYFVANHPTSRISLCDSLAGPVLKKLNKISILNDFSGKINHQSQQQVYDLAFTDQEHRQEIKNSFTHKYKLMFRSKQDCGGLKLDVYCLEDG